MKKANEEIANLKAILTGLLTVTFELFLVNETNVLSILTAHQRALLGVGVAAGGLLASYGMYRHQIANPRVEQDLEANNEVKLSK